MFETKEQFKMLFLYRVESSNGEIISKSVGNGEWSAVRGSAGGVTDYCTSIAGYLEWVLLQLIIIIGNRQGNRQMSIENMITENFDIKEIIGHGATSTVRRAVNKVTGEQFAIKVYENERMKAKNEIDMLMRLDHPSIVNIYDIYEDEDTIVLVLEYMEGGELYNMVGNKTKFSESQVREYMKAVVDAVRYCHELGIVHRDIKPENLLMTTRGPDAILKLADFGISKILTEQMLNTNCGTPIYMAPQIWQAQLYNEKVDIWSMGVMMYYLLGGCHPFEGDNESMIAKITEQQLIFPEEMLNTVSSKAINLLRQILNKDPAQRPSAKDVANHLWLNHIDSIPKDPLLAQEINLLKTVHKIRRYIVKERLKKNNKLFHDLLHNKKVSRKRLQFLLMQSEFTMTEESEMITESGLE